MLVESKPFTIQYRASHPLSFPVPFISVTNLMDLFRAVQKKEEYSERVLELIEELLELNAGNYTVWYQKVACHVRSGISIS